MIRKIDSTRLELLYDFKIDRPCLNFQITSAALKSDNKFESDFKFKNYLTKQSSILNTYMYHTVHLLIRDDNCNTIDGNAIQNSMYCAQ